MDGMAFGTWAALIPSFQQKFRGVPIRDDESRMLRETEMEIP
jgi:hypothetical protein